jgi:hypothetical protein
MPGNVLVVRLCDLLRVLTLQLELHRGSHDALGGPHNLRQLHLGEALRELDITAQALGYVREQQATVAIQVRLYHLAQMAVLAVEDVMGFVDHLEIVSDLLSKAKGRDLQRVAFQQH